MFDVERARQRKWNSKMDLLWLAIGVDRSNDASHKPFAASQISPKLPEKTPTGPYKTFFTGGIGAPADVVLMHADLCASAYLMLTLKVPYFPLSSFWDFLLIATEPLQTCSSIVHM